MIVCVAGISNSFGFCARNCLFLSLGPDWWACLHYMKNTMIYYCCRPDVVSVNCGLTVTNLKTIFYFLMYSFSKFWFIELWNGTKRSIRRTFLSFLFSSQSKCIYYMKLEVRLSYRQIYWSEYQQVKIQNHSKEINQKKLYC